VCVKDSDSSPVEARQISAKDAFKFALLNLSENCLYIDREDAMGRICRLPDHFEATTPVARHVCIGGKEGMIAFIKLGELVRRDARTKQDDRSIRLPALVSRGGLSPLGPSCRRHLRGGSSCDRRCYVVLSLAFGVGRMYCLRFYCFDLDIAGDGPPGPASGDRRQTDAQAPGSSVSRWRAASCERSLLLNG
jgi:hypothetical protein